MFNKLELVPAFWTGIRPVSRLVIMTRGTGPLLTSALHSPSLAPRRATEHTSSLCLSGLPRHINFHSSHSRATAAPQVYHNANKVSVIIRC
jgi:hypothetical protein